MLKPFLIIITVLTIEETFHNFDLMYTLTAGGPYFHTEIVEIYIYRWAFGASIPQLGHASAAAVIFGLLVAVVGAVQLWGVYMRPSAERTTAMTAQLAVPRSDRTSRQRRVLRRLPWWLAAIFLVGIAVIWIFPFLWMLSASLKDNMEMFSGGLKLWPDKFVWDNYARAWNDAHFGRYLINTVVVTVFTVVIVTIRCATAGYVLARYRFHGSKIFLGVLVATLFVPTGYTIIPVVKISMQLHLIDSLGGMILALSGGAYVSAILIYYGYFRQIPRELEEAAVVDGAGFFRTFFSVMLPLAMPVTATVAVLTFITTWNAFFLPLVFTFSKPDLRTVSVGMQAFVGETATDWSGMAAAGVISIVPVVVLFIFLQRSFVEGISGAVKA